MSERRRMKARVATETVTSRRLESTGEILRVESLGTDTAFPQDAGEQRRELSRILRQWTYSSRFKNGTPSYRWTHGDW